MFKKFFKNSAIILAASTGLLYIIGIASHNGYISEFGMPTKLFPLNFYQALKTGFLNVLSIVLQHLHYIIYVLVGCLIVIGILLLLKKYFPRNEENKLEEKTKDVNEEKREISNIWDTSINFFDKLQELAFKFIVYFFAFLIPFLGIGYLANELGKENAQDLKKDYKRAIKSDNEVDIELVDIMTPNRNYTGVIVTYSSNYLMIFNKSGTEIINNSEIRTIRKKQ